MVVSTFTWLDHDAEQARRSAELVRALTEPDTVDSIGIGAIRDGFAGIFFPGTSTIQTRARYFLLVPWAMRTVASRRPRDRAQYDRFLSEIETATIAALIKGNVKDELGIIGRQRGAATKRKASSVYWSALGDWGIRVAHDMTMSGYRSYVLSRRTSERLDGEPGDAAVFQVWDELPRTIAGFPDEPLEILPQPDEADYLLARMVATHAGGIGHVGVAVPSVLAAAARATQTIDVPHLWDLPESVIPRDLRAAALHAERFSLVIQGARLRYVQLLFDAQHQAGLSPSPGQDELSRLVANWLIEVEAADTEVRDWIPALPDMYHLLARYGVAVGSLTREFVERWSTEVARDPTIAMTSSAAGSLIRDREIYLKSPNARLASDSALRSWDGSIFGGSRLDYRWGVAQRMIRDCRTVLETGHAGA